MKILVKNGVVKFIYNDKLVGLFKEGKVKIKRASHVEPTQDGKWIADLNPIQPGIILGPFTLRSKAIKAEVEWLERNLSRI